MQSVDVFAGPPHWGVVGNGVDKPYGHAGSLRHCILISSRRCNAPGPSMLSWREGSMKCLYALRVQRGKATCTCRSSPFSRKGYNWTDRFGSIGELVDGLPADNVILDGEVVFIGRNGKPDLQGLRGALGRKTDRLHLYAFDLLFLDGEDWRLRPLLERKRRLQALLHGRRLVGHSQGEQR
jgi:hypothetical protein